MVPTVPSKKTMDHASKLLAAPDCQEVPRCQEEITSLTSNPKINRTNKPHNSVHQACLALKAVFWLQCVAPPGWGPVDRSIVRALAGEGPRTGSVLARNHTPNALCVQICCRSTKVGRICIHEACGQWMLLTTPEFGTGAQNARAMQGFWVRSWSIVDSLESLLSGIQNYRSSPSSCLLVIVSPGDGGRRRSSSLHRKGIDVAPTTTGRAVVGA